MLFYNFYLTKIGTKIEIVLKNSLVITGKLMSVDPYLNFKLEDIETVFFIDGQSHGLSRLETCSIRGSTVKFARFPACLNDIQRLETASRFRACSNIK